VHVLHLPPAANTKKIHFKRAAVETLNVLQYTPCSVPHLAVVLVVAPADVGDENGRRLAQIALHQRLIPLQRGSRNQRARGLHLQRKALLPQRQVRDVKRSVSGEYIDLNA
jgi:hypothetical protein